MDCDVKYSQEVYSVEHKSFNRCHAGEDKKS